MRNKICIGLIIVLGSFFVSCTATSKFMQQNGDALKAAPATATVVFFRHSGYATGKAPIILTDNGKYMGEGLPKVKYAVRLPAGQYMFIAWGEGNYSIKANLKAGKTYYVVVAPKLGAWSPRFHLVPIKQGDENWVKREELLAKCEPYAVDLEAGQADLATKDQVDVKSVIEKGKTRFTEYNDGDKKKFTLDPEDGI